MSKNKKVWASLKDLDFPLSSLQARGFRVVEMRNEPYTADRFDLLPMTHNILNFINDNRAQNVRLAEFDDETILMEAGGETFRLFGAEFEDTFMESTSDGAVYCEMGPDADPETPHRLFVSSDIRAFARCRAYFDALVSRMNSKFMPYRSIDRAELRSAYAEAAVALQDFISDIDPPAMSEETYWHIRQDMFAEGGLKLNPGIEYYSRKGRVAVSDS